MYRLSLFVRRFGFAILIGQLTVQTQSCDATTAAYAHKLPIISVDDCGHFLGGLRIPHFATNRLLDILEQILRQYSPEGLLTHQGLRDMTQEVNTWIAQALRAFAVLSVSESGKLTGGRSKGADVKWFRPSER